MTCGPPPVPRAVLLAGFGAANQAAARALISRGHAVTAFDDRPGPAAEATAAELGMELVAAPGRRRLAALVREAELLIPTPGLPERHPVLAAAAGCGTPAASEFDLARVWDDRPIAAITGTSGKTTVTETAVAALCASGVAAMAAGNNDMPLVEAIDRPDIEVFVVEASSFRLGRTRRFRPRVGCWLNFAPDHLDVHRDLASYEAAKARLWRDLRDDGDGPARGAVVAARGAVVAAGRGGAADGIPVAVANLDDPIVMRHVPPGCDVQTFSERSQAHWSRRGSELVGPQGPFASVRDLRRRRPHDVANALAAAATATAVGATAGGVRQALSRFEPGSHRLQRVAEIKGVEYYNDSKATTPHATMAALRGLEAVVLVAGGRNKGLDLGELAGGIGHIRSVVAVGEAADEIAAVFAGRRPVARAGDMDEAVRLAAAAAEPPASVLLSPACASFDAYRGYAERGDDFMRAVRDFSRSSKSSERLTSR